MTKRDQLKQNIKDAKKAKQEAHGQRAIRLTQLRDARQQYDITAEALEAAQAALVAFDNGGALPE